MDVSSGKFWGLELECYVGFKVMFSGFGGWKVVKRKSTRREFFR